MRKFFYFIPYKSSKKVEKSAGLSSKQSARILAKENPQFYFTSVLASSSQREDRKLYFTNICMFDSQNSWVLSHNSRVREVVDYMHTELSNLATEYLYENEKAR